MQNQKLDFTKKLKVLSTICQHNIILMSQAKSNKPNNNNQNNFDDDSSDDDAPWEPEDDFNEVFIRVDENNNCVISGPPEKVAKIKEQIVNAVLDGQDKIAASKLNSINSFEFQMQ